MRLKIHVSLVRFLEAPQNFSFMFTSVFHHHHFLTGLLDRWWYLVEN